MVSNQSWYAITWITRECSEQGRMQYDNSFSSQKFGWNTTAMCTAGIPLCYHALPTKIASKDCKWHFPFRKGPLGIMKRNNTKGCCRWGVQGPRNIYRDKFEGNLRQIEPLTMILFVSQNKSFSLSFISWSGPLAFPFKMMPCRRHLTLPFLGVGLSFRNLWSNYTSWPIRLLHFVGPPLGPHLKRPLVYTMYTHDLVRRQNWYGVFVKVTVHVYGN